MGELQAKVVYTAQENDPAPKSGDLCITWADLSGNKFKSYHKEDEPVVALRKDAIGTIKTASRGSGCTVVSYRTEDLDPAIHTGGQQQTAATSDGAAPPASNGAAAPQATTGQGSSIRQPLDFVQDKNRWLLIKEEIRLRSELVESLAKQYAQLLADVCHLKPEDGDVVDQIAIAKLVATTMIGAFDKSNYFDAERTFDPALAAYMGNEDMAKYIAQKNSSNAPAMQP